MTQLSKLQIRAKVLSVISEVKTLKSFNENLLDKYIKELSDIEDKSALFDIFIKEFIKLEEQEYIFCSCLIKELVDTNVICDKTYEILKSPNYGDDAKYKLVQLLRITGNSADYTNMPEYFDNPQKVLDMETKKLLETAEFNPESMLDFLDFISAVGAKDRGILLSSLSMDYKGDILANLIYPILYSDFEDEFIIQTVEILADSKSSLALAPFEYLIKTSDNKDIVKACETGIKKLKLSGADTKKADEYFNNIVSDSKPAQFFTTIPDGSGNQAFLISRVNVMGKCLLSAVVTNQNFGISDCFGFYNISQEELIRIIDKFYSSEGKYAVNPEYVKSKIKIAIEKTIELKRKFPYEFICWYPMLSDVNAMDITLEEYVLKNCKKQIMSKNNVLDLLTKEYTFRWFIIPSENKILNAIAEDFYSKEDISIDYINKTLLDKVDNIFDDYTNKIWQDKIYDLIYLLRKNDKTKEADNFYTVLSDINLYNVFKKVTIQRSIFNHFVTLYENSKNSLFTTNIFAKKNVQNNKYDVKKIKNILDILRKNWINE